MAEINWPQSEMGGAVKFVIPRPAQNISTESKLDEILIRIDKLAEIQKKNLALTKSLLKVMSSINRSIKY